MRATKKRRLVHSAAVTAIAAGTLMVGAPAANASSQIFGGGDCWAYLFPNSRYVTVQSLNDSCTSLGARHKWSIAGVTGYTDWNYSTNYWVNSDVASVLQVGYGRAYD